MEKQKQIEEIKDWIDSMYGCDCAYFGVDGLMIAEGLYNAGYRKQIAAEWIGKVDYAGYGYYCSNCNAVFVGEHAEWIARGHEYCPKCGAKMKGADNGKAD